MANRVTRASNSRAHERAASGRAGIRVHKGRTSRTAWMIRKSFCCSRDNFFTGSCRSVRVDHCGVTSATLPRPEAAEHLDDGRVVAAAQAGARAGAIELFGRRCQWGGDGAFAGGVRDEAHVLDEDVQGALDVLGA